MKNTGTGHKPKNKAKSMVNANLHKQTSFFKINSKHRFSYGGILRNKRAGRGLRPLSTKSSLHLVFKVNTEKLRRRSLRSPQCFKLITWVINKYAKSFTIKIEQISIQNNHIHALIRTSNRSQYQYFFRVVAGQIAQCFEKEGLLQTSVTDTPKAQVRQLRLWKFCPFTRVVIGWKAYQIVRNYIQLNEKEALREIRYQKNRLRGLSSADWEILWT